MCSIRRAIEAIAENLERGVVTRRFPPEPLNAETRKMDFLPPALRRMRSQQRHKLERSEGGEFAGKAWRGAARERFHGILRRKLLEVVMQQR